MTNLILLQTLPDEREANMLASVLEAHGVRTSITGAFSAEFRAEAPGIVRLYVSAEDAPQAESIVQELQEARGENEVEEDYGKRVFGWRSNWILQCMKWCLILALISELVGFLFSIPELFNRG